MTRLPGFETVRAIGTITLLRQNGDDLGAAFDRPQPRLARGIPALVSTPAGTEAVLKRYFRGGWVRFLGARYLSWSPLRREIAVAEHLRRHGVGAPEILAARAERSPWGWYRLEILSRRIPEAERLSDRLRALTGRRRTHALGLVSGSIRKLHDAGVVHGDLNVDNILWSPWGIHFVDFDRAKIRARVSRRDRTRDLRRLLRSARKRRLPIFFTDSTRFLRGYGLES